MSKILETDRLMLRPPRRSDAPVFYRLINDPQIAANTLGIPYPFSYEQALSYIQDQLDRINTGEYRAFALALKPENQFIGYARLALREDHQRAELAYWLGKAYWNNGYTSEAVACLVDYGFQRLHLNRIYALCFADNTGSARVMQKAGLVYEGTWREDVLKNGVYKDVMFYGISRDRYETASR